MSETLKAQVISDVVLMEQTDQAYSRDAVVNPVAFVYAANITYQNGVGCVVGKITVGAVTGAAKAGNTGNGTIGTLSALAGARPGVYQAICIEAATNAGRFQVYDPNGKPISTVAVAAANAAKVAFTIADGSTDFAAGDGFDITVAAGTGDIVMYDPTVSNGADEVYGVMLIPNAAVAGKAIVLRRGPAVVKKSQLVWAAAVNDDSKKGVGLAALTEMGILNRDIA